MAANITDLVTQATNGTRPTPTTLTALKAIAAPSISIGASTGWPTATAVHFIIYTTDASGNKVAGSQTDWKGVVTGTTIGSLVLKAGTDNGYSVGAIVEAAPTAAWANDVVAAWIVDHTQLGYHQDLHASNGKVTLGLTDSSTAVNNLRATAAATTLDPTLSAEGSDANVNLGLAAKGTGQIKFKSNHDGWIYNTLPAYSSAVYNGFHSAVVTFASSVANLLSPGMKIRSSRTVAAPTQSALFTAASSHYFSRASGSLTGMTFTGNHTLMAWIKVTSLPASAGQEPAIVGRTDAAPTGGFALHLSATGQIRAFYGTASTFTDFLSNAQVSVGRWIHVAVSVNAAAKTCVMLFDGAVVATTSAFTAATSLTQVGNLEIGRYTTGPNYFNGAIAQVAIFSSNIATATIQGYISQGLTGSETNLVSAWSLNNSLNDLNANANTLTANNGVTATNADSPFTTNASGVPGGTFDYGIVTAVSGSTATITSVEGSMIPTSGGVSAMEYSPTKNTI